MSIFQSENRRENCFLEGTERWGWEDKKGDPRQKYPGHVRDSSFPSGPILWPGTLPQLGAWDSFSEEPQEH